MKKLLVLILLSANIVLSQTKTKTTPEWKTLDGTEFSIQYPSNWTVDKSGQGGTSFILFAPEDIMGDMFKENVNLLIQDLSGKNMDLAKYTELSITQFKKMMPGSTLVESKRLKGAKFDFQKVTNTAKQGDLNLRFIQYYWVVLNRAFVLTFSCEEGKHAAYKENSEKIMNSFKFK